MGGGFYEVLIKATLNCYSIIMVGGKFLNKLSMLLLDNVILFMHDLCY